MKTALITGASSGIGRATALGLAELGFHVVAAARSMDSTRTLVDEIEARSGSARSLFLDLSSLEMVKVAADEFLGNDCDLDVLINNAGVGRARGTTVDGFETHFGINHLGHFLLTRLLEPSLVTGARVVNVASAVHHRAEAIDFETLTQGRQSMFGIDEYAVSKLCNILFTVELAKRRPDQRSFAVHPGLVATNILPAWLRLLGSTRMATPEEGAATSIWAATDPSLSDQSGGYYANCALERPSSTAQDQGLAAELWHRSEEWCGLVDD